jgi:hypothetical protein
MVMSSLLLRLVISFNITVIKFALPLIIYLPILFGILSLNSILLVAI